MLHSLIVKKSNDQQEKYQKVQENCCHKFEIQKKQSVVIVTLAEATPVLEASRLQDDLMRANIHPKWWVINQSSICHKYERSYFKRKSDGRKGMDSRSE